MKEKRIFLIGVILSGILGWTLGFLRLPYLEKNYSFFLGFAACLSIISLGVLIIKIWKKNLLLASQSDANSASSKFSRTHTSLWFLVAMVIVGGSLGSGYLFFKQNKYAKNQLLHLDQQTANQLELMASTRKSNALILMNNLYDKINEELKNSPDRKLSTPTIERIATLNHSFEPYRYLENGQLSEKKWSPERGQLLLMLIKMNIDTSSFSQIKSTVSFLGADLKGTDLNGADLSGIDLRQANLADSKLQKVILKKADLREINLWGTNLSGANLKSADLKRADLQWADLDNANLNNADMDDANLSSAKLRNVTLREARLRWGEMKGALLNGADLMGMDLLATDLSRANFANTNLSNTNLRWAILKETDFTQANLEEVLDLTNAAVPDEQWLSNLEKLQVTGATTIQTNYKIVKIKSDWLLQPSKKKG